MGKSAKKIPEPVSSSSDSSSDSDTNITPVVKSAVVQKNKKEELKVKAPVLPSDSSSDSDDSTDEEIVTKPALKASKVAAAASSDESSDDSEPEVTTKAKVAAKKASSSDEDSSSSEDEKPAVKAKIPAPTTDSDSSDDDSEDEVTPPPKKSSAARTKIESKTAKAEDLKKGSKKAAKIVKLVEKEWICCVQDSKKGRKPEWKVSQDNTDTVSATATVELDTREDSDGQQQPVFRFVSQIEEVKAEVTKPVKASKTNEKAAVSSSSDSSDSEDEEMDNAESKKSAEKVADSQKKRPRTSVDTESRPVKKQATEDDPSACEIFSGGWPFGTTEEDIRKVFEESCGSVTRVKVLGQGGAAFITFGTVEGASSALEWNQTEYQGRKLNINRASDKPQGKQQQQQGGNFNRDNGQQVPNSTVIVRNIPFSAAEDDFRNMFGECGEIQSVRIPQFQDTGKPRGFAMVNFSSAEEAKAAIELSGSDLSGRCVTIEIARPRENSGNDRGGRGGGMNRGGRGGMSRGRGNSRGGRMSGGGPSGNHHVFDD